MKNTINYPGLSSGLLLRMYVKQLSMPVFPACEDCESTINDKPGTATKGLDKMSTLQTQESDTILI